MGSSEFIDPFRCRCINTSPTGNDSRLRIVPTSVSSAVPGEFSICGGEIERLTLGVADGDACSCAVGAWVLAGPVGSMGTLGLHVLSAEDINTSQRQLTRMGVLKPRGAFLRRVVLYIQGVLG